MRALIGFFLICIAAVGWIFFFQPEFVSVRSLSQDIESVRVLRDEIEGLIAKRDELYTEYQAIPSEEVSRLMAVAPDDLETPDMIVAIESLANQNGVTLKQIEFSSPAAGGMGADSSAFIAVPVSFSIDGTYDNFLSFVKSVERNVRLVDVTDFAFGDLSSPQRMSFSVRGKTYYRR